MADIDDVYETDDLTRDVSLLVAIAKVEAALHAGALELDKIPTLVDGLGKKLAELDRAEAAAVGALDAMQKERRTLERGLQDAEAAVTKYKNQLMAVKTNKEYTAMLKEIELKEAEIGVKEERILELMESIEVLSEKNRTDLARIAEARAHALAEKQTLEERRVRLESEAKKLGAERPKLIAEVAPVVQKRYHRVHEKHGGVTVTRTENGHCGGCGTQLPPQVVVEVKKNNQLITCQSCGRILIDYP